MGNILIGKSGKCVVFNKDKWAPQGGSHEAPYLLYLLAKRYPQHNFYIVGRTDYHKYFKGNDLLPNIIDVWDKKYWFNEIPPVDYTKPAWRKNDNEEDQIKFHENYWSYPFRVLQKLNVKADLMIDLLGVIYFNSFKGILPRKDGSGDFCHCMETTERYNAPMTYLENKIEELGCSEVVHIMTDPRQIHGNINYTLIRKPDIFLSQYEKEIRYKDNIRNCYFPRNNLVKRDVNFDLHYCAFETLKTCVFEEIDNFPEKKNFGLLLNFIDKKDTDGEIDLYNKLNNWVLKDKDFDCEVHGVWPDEYYKKDIRIKPALKFFDLSKYLLKLKYTLVIAREPNYITPKFLEHCHHGVFPFVTNDYAIGIPDCYIPDFCRVNSLEDLKQRIEYYENNPDVYKRDIQILINIPKKNKMYTGDYFLKRFTSHLKFDFGKSISVSKPIGVLYNEDVEKCLKGHSHSTNETIEDLFA